MDEEEAKEAVFAVEEEWRDDGEGMGWTPSLHKPL